LKPANVLLAADGTPKVTDFGLAKRLDAGPGLTRTGAILGTPSYMAPEQAGGRPERVGPAADIYALGAILYECLTGRPPFRAETALETLEQMRTQDPVPPRRLQPKVPRDLETVCLQCLHKQPPRRYAGALDLAEDLGRFGRGEPIRARPASAGELAWKWAKRRPAVAALIGLAAAVLMAAAAGVAYHNRRLREEVIIAQAAQSAAVTSAETARAAERKADASARTALKTLDRLVFQVQEKLRSTPATRQLRQGLLETALDGLREVAGAGDAATPDVLRAAAHLQMGDIHWQLGRVPEALAEQQRCRDTAAALLAADPGNADARHYEALALHRLGSYNLKRGNTALARQLMQQAVDHTEAWCAAAPADARARADRAQSYRHLGFACQWVADLPAAEAAYRRLQALAQAWLDEAPGDREARFALTVVYGSLAQIAEDRGDLTAARDLHGRSLAVSEALAAEEPANDQYRRSLMVDRFNLGTICRRLGDLSAARGHLDAALATARARAAADPENVPCQIDLVDGLRGRGALECDELQFAAAAPYFEEGLAVLQRLDAAGKLADTPMFQKEWMDEFRHHVEICRLVPRVMADEAVLWRQPPRLACPLALDRIGLLLRDGRPADAVATGEALGRFTPADADGWFRLGRTCARAAGVLGRRAGPAAEPVVGRLIQSSLDGFRRALELGYPYFSEEKLKTDPDLEPLRRHPGFPALIEQLRKRRHSP
jgi:tetratricopeptide (TPR) repeat protein